MEAVGLLVLTTAVCVIIFVEKFFSVQSNSPQAYAIFPFVIWAATRFGQPATATVAFVASCIAIWGTVKGSGPFVVETRHENLLLLQAFTGVVAVSGLFLASAVAEREGAHERLRQRDGEVRQLNAVLEQRVAERTQQLSLANQELEAFSYSISHDLRVPLRAIDGFSRALLQDCGEGLNPQGRHCLKRIRAGVGRMTQLVDAMLELFRTTVVEVRSQPVDLSRLARGIADELWAEAPDRRVEFSIADGLLARGDRELLRDALANLLGNAWKFTGGNVSARIEFAGIDGGEEGRVYYVRDNGAGFEMERAAKLFSPFCRLHRESEYQGVGIGLATVQRIIRRHHGRVWAESAVGQGTTVYFTLGPNPPTGPTLGESAGSRSACLPAADDLDRRDQHHVDAAT